MTSQELKDFWNATRSELDRVPTEAALAEARPSEPFVMDTNVKTRTIYEVRLKSLGNVSIRAWYVVPANEPPLGGWPAIMVLPPYKEIMPLPLHLVPYGFATLSLFPRGQSISRSDW